MDELNNKNDKLISMMAAVDAVETIGFDFSDSGLSAAEIEEVCEAIGEVRQEWSRRIKRLPSAQPERDIPMKPNETIDSSWGIRKKQAVCPKCDYYLNRIYFLGDSKNKKVTYCETCGQAIDWEGWDWEDE